MSENKPKILIVEGEAIIALGLKVILERHGYALLGLAKTGAHALKIAGGMRPDLALVDVDLPGKADGIDTALQLRKMGVQVACLTTHLEEKTLEWGRTVGINHFILKPYDEADVCELVSAVLEKKKS